MKLALFSPAAFATMIVVYFLGLILAAPAPGLTTIALATIGLTTSTSASTTDLVTRQQAGW